MIDPRKYGIRLRHIIIAAAFVLALTQYVANKSLWVDDARVALNLMETPHAGLAKELRYNQSAPVVFLQLEKLLLRAVPDSEYGMKFLPFVSFLAAIFLFGKIARTLLKNECAADAALAVFAFNSAMLFYSSEIKQYSSDAALALLLFWLALRPWKNELVKLRVLGGAGAASVFCSNTAPLALAAAGLWLAFDTLKTGFDLRKTKRLAVLAVVWLFAFGAYWDAFVPPPESFIRRYMEWYWDVTNPAFVFSHGLKRAPMLLVRQSGAFLAFYFGNPVAAGFAVLLASAGFVAAVKSKNARVLFFTALPFVLHFIASSAKIYPFAQRFLVWCFPGFVILAALPLDMLLTRAEGCGRTARRLAAFVCAALVTAALAMALADFPVAARQESKPTILRAIENAEPENVRVVVMSQACYAFEYYARIGLVPETVLAKSAGIGWDEGAGRPGEMRLRASGERFADLKGLCWILTVSVDSEGLRFIPQHSRHKGPDSFAKLEKKLFSKNMADMRDTDGFREREGLWKYTREGFVGMKTEPAQNESADSRNDGLPFLLPPGARLKERFDANGAGAYLVDFGD